MFANNTKYYKNLCLRNQKIGAVVFLVLLLSFASLVSVYALNGSFSSMQTALPYVAGLIGTVFDYFPEALSSVAKYYHVSNSGQTYFDAAFGIENFTEASKVMMAVFEKGVISGLSTLIAKRVMSAMFSNMTYKLDLNDPMASKNLSIIGVIIFKGIFEVLMWNAVRLNTTISPDQKGLLIYMTSVAPLWEALGRVYLATEGGVFSNNNVILNLVTIYATFVAKNVTEKIYTHVFSSTGLIRNLTSTIGYSPDGYIPVIGYIPTLIGGLFVYMPQRFEQIGRAVRRNRAGATDFEAETPSETTSLPTPNRLVTLLAFTGSLVLIDIRFNGVIFSSRNGIFAKALERFNSMRSQAKTQAETAIKEAAQQPVEPIRQPERRNTLTRVVTTLLVISVIAGVGVYLYQLRRRRKGE